MSAAAAVFSYNAVEFDYVLTKNWSQECVYTDEDGEFLYIRHSLTIQGVISPSFNDDDKPGTTMVSIREALLEPRANLIYKQDGVTILNVTGPDGIFTQANPDYDAKGGPFPRNVSVTEIHGSKTFLVEMTIDTFLLHCTTTEPPNTLSNRWQISHDIDENFRSTRTINGTLIVRA